MTTRSVKKSRRNARLKIAIFERGLRQYEVAEQAGMRESRLSRIISGQIIPSSREQERLAKVLKASPADLFDEQTRVVGAAIGVVSDSRVVA